MNENENKQAPVENAPDAKDLALAKALMKEFPAEFDAAKIYDEGLKNVINSSRNESLSRVDRLIKSIYYEMKEISQKKNELEKLETSLAKKQEQVEALKKGDLSVLFGGNKK